MIAATQLRVGNLIMYNGKPWRVASMVHRTPGNLRGFVQAKLVNIENGSNTEVRFSSEDKVEKASLDQHTLQFSYKAGDDFHFMNTQSYEMVELTREVLGDNAGYLIDGMTIWERKRDGGFPEIKILKQKVRDVIDPERDLGHVDRQTPSE